MKTLARLLTIAKINKQNINYINKDLYRLFYDKELFIIAYEKIKSIRANEGFDGFSLSEIEKIIEQIKNKTYKFSPATRIYIPKSGKNELRPIDIGNIKDKVILEIVRMILEAIFEPTFLKNSHGFRPNKSCHSALESLKINFNGIKWVIEADIKKYFNSIDHNILISLLERRIQDINFIQLIRKVLNAGYLEFKIHKTDIIGVPQGNIISPILSNIYLHELDVYMENLEKSFYKGKVRKPNKAYKNITLKMWRLREKGLYKESELLRKELCMPASDFNDPNYRRLKYIRYCDDFVIGIIGTRKETVKIKEDIKNFMKEKLKLDLNEQKTLITHTSKTFLFLGTNIKIPFYKENKITTRVVKGITRKNKLSSSLPRLDMPLKRVKDKLIATFFCNKKGNPIPKFLFYSYTHNEIIKAYNAIIYGILNYYSFVSNTSSLGYICYLLKSSAAKLLAAKFKLRTQAKVYSKFGRFLTSPEGTKIAQRRDLKVRKLDFHTKEIKTNIPELYYGRLTRSILRKICGICGSTNRIEMHHVKHLRNMKKTLTPMEKSMVSLNRKQIPVCKNCHMEIHKGKYDGLALKDIISK